MDSPIVPTGGPMGQSPIEPKLGDINRPEIEESYQTLPENGGDPVSCEKVVENCDQLKHSTLPETLDKVVSASREANGKIPIGPLVASAKNSEVLAAMFASLVDKE